MGFTRSLIKSYRIVSMYDEAVDHDHPRLLEKIAEYNKGCDISVLPVKEGHTLSIWECRPLTRAQHARVSNGDEDTEEKRILKAREALTISLISVSDFRTSEGVTVIVDHAKVGDEVRVKPEIMELLFDPAVGKELHSRILRANALNPMNG